MMMAFGQFVFSLSTLAYEELQRQTSWRHPRNSVVGSRARGQFTGPGDDTITLTGRLLPEFAGTADSLDQLREMGATGQAWPLVDGSGKVYGAFVIESLRDTRSVFMSNGAARVIEFQLQLSRIDDDRTDSIGSSPATASTNAV